MINPNDNINIDFSKPIIIFDQNHNKLLNLDYEHSGHTGFASSSEIIHNNLFWCKKEENNIILDVEKPSINEDNYIDITKNNSSFNWDDADFVIDFELSNKIRLNRDSYFTINLPFVINVDEKICFGAKISISTDGSSWNEISSKQIFGSKSYVAFEGANKINYNEKFDILTDLINSTSEYEEGTLIKIFIYKKIIGGSELTTEYYFGSDITGEDLYSYVRIKQN